MVRDAEAAGFNPLTALRNGGAAGFSVTSQPVLSSGGQALGEAFGQIGNFISNFDPFEDKMREVQFQTMQAQLANLQADTALKGRQFMFDPPAVSGRRKVTAGPSLGQAPLPADAGVSLTPEVEAPTLTNPWPMSWGIEVNPDSPDGQAFEDRYGDSELLSTLFGGWQLGSDLYHTKKRSIEKEIKGASKKYQEKVKSNAAREKKIRAQALKNARDLGFKGY